MKMVSKLLFAFLLTLGLSVAAQAQCSTAGPEPGTFEWSAGTDPISNQGSACFAITADDGSDLSFFVSDTSTAGTWLYLLSGPGIDYLSTAGVVPGAEFRLDYANVLGGVYSGIIYLTNLNGVPDARVNYGAVITAPIPEPSTYALMLAGLSTVVYMARRRREKPAALVLKRT